MIDIEKYEPKKCKGCNKNLSLKDWPYLFKVVNDICNECKLKVNNILNKERKI